MFFLIDQIYNSDLEGFHTTNNELVTFQIFSCTEVLVNIRAVLAIYIPYWKCIVNSTAMLENGLWLIDHYNTFEW